MRKIVIILVTALLMVNTAYAEYFDNQQEYSFVTKEPVMIIRFNKTEVAYEKKLKVVAEEALKVNQDSKFIIKFFFRSRGGASDANLAKREIQKIINHLMKLGITEENIIQEIIFNEKAQGNEIHIWLGH